MHSPAQGLCTGRRATVEMGKETHAIPPQDLEKELNTSLVFAVTLFIFVLSIYVATLHPSVSGGDNGELLGCACELGK